MNLKSFMSFHAHKVEADNYTDFSFNLHNRVDVIIRFRFATTITECASLLNNAKLFGRLHRTNLTVNSPYGKVTENVLCFDVGSGKYKEDYKASNSSMDAVSFSLSEDADAVSFNIFENGKLIKMLNHTVFTNVEY